MSDQNATNAAIRDELAPQFNPDDHRDAIGRAVAARMGVEYVDPDTDADPVGVESAPEPANLIPPGEAAVTSGASAPVVDLLGRPAPEPGSHPASIDPIAPPSEAEQAAALGIPDSPDSGFVIAGTDAAAAIEAAGAPAASVSEGEGAAHSPSPSDQLDINRLLTEAYGQAIEPTAVLQVFDTYEQLTRLPSAYQQAIGAMLQGAPPEQIAQSLGLTAPAAPATAAPAAPAPAAPTYTDPWADPPPAAPAHDPILAARLAELEARQVAQEQAAYQAELARAQAEALAGADAFAQSRASVLDPTDIAIVQKRANQNIQWVNQRAAELNGDYRTAYTEALEAAAYMVPTVRSKLIAAEAAPVQEQVVQEQVRQSKSAALAGGGAPSSPLQAVTATPAAPTSAPVASGPVKYNRQSAAAAMAAELRRQTQGQNIP